MDWLKGILIGVLLILVNFLLWYPVIFPEDTSGGNEIIATACNESGELRILVGRYNGERKWIGTGLDCQKEDK